MDRGYSKQESPCSQKESFISHLHGKSYTVKNFANCVMQICVTLEMRSAVEVCCVAIVTHCIDLTVFHLVIAFTY